MNPIRTILAVAALLAAGIGTAQAQGTEILDFDPTGRDFERIAVAAGNVIELTKFEGDDPTADGRADVFNLNTLETYVIPDGVETCRTAVIDPNNPSIEPLVFLSRSSARISDILAEGTAIDPDEHLCQ